MKRIALSLMLLSLAASGFSQKSNVRKAENALVDPVDLASAKSNIEAAMQNPETSKWEKTYYVAGNVYYKFYESEETKRLKQESYSQAVKDENLVKAIDAYAKAGEYGMQPDEKGKVKPKYQKEVKRNLEQYGKYLINEGLASYNAKDYKQAAKLWTKYLEVPTYPVMAGVGMEKDTLYNEIKYYVVDAASRVPELKPLAIKSMEELRDAGYKEESMYEWLAGEYKEAKQMDKYVANLQNGMKKFPKNQFLMGSLINYYIESKKESEAVAYLDEAVKNDPKNAQYLSVKGNLLMNMKKFDDAITAFNQAAAVDPNNASAYSGLGIVYVTKGEDINEKADDIKDPKKYKAERARAKAEFEKAIPYLQKARTLDPKDLNNLRVLRAAYLRVDNGVEYKKIDAEVKALEESK
ncbi:MAG: tetratricopeptide repeat protein [Paludibacteraceae bacterium]|nr:tetratricopeptide repeat protein [Paludibacteraceae bacterium]